VSHNIRAPGSNALTEGHPLAQGHKDYSGNSWMEQTQRMLAHLRCGHPGCGAPLDPQTWRATEDTCFCLKPFTERHLNDLNKRRVYERPDYMTK